MSEKEINEIVEEHYGFTVEEIDNMVGNLSLKIYQLQQRIDKAIEFIKNNYDFYYGDELLEEYEKILDILGGKE